jgi:hypothetical protein
MAIAANARLQLSSQGDHRDVGASEADVDVDWFMESVETVGDAAGAARSALTAVVESLQAALEDRLAQVPLVQVVEQQDHLCTHANVTGCKEMTECCTRTSTSALR